MAVCHYLESIEKNKIFTEPEKNRYIILDTETTGLDYKNDQVLSIGAIRIENLEINISDSFEVILQTETAGDKESIAVHGIRTQDVKQGIQRDFAFEQFLYFLQGDIIVGHHILFDKLILSNNIKKIFSIELLNPIIDTFDVAIYYENLVKKRNVIPEEANPEEFSLDNLLNRFRIKSSGRHTSIGDALLTAELFLRMMKKLIQQKNFRIESLIKY
ncbi:MAG: exonuclease domain-containing protein [Leptospiraceae bacterium]|nr:exonuclease domain-containing protein [Leptospiraceae bacterium]